MTTGTRISQSAFESALGDLDTEAFVTFVGELWAGTAESVTVDPPVVTVDSERGRQRLLVRTDDSACDHALDDIDAIVSAVPVAETERNVTAIGPQRLRDRLLYGLPPDAADDLCERFLGAPARTESVPASDDDSNTETAGMASASEETQLAGTDSSGHAGQLAVVRNRLGSRATVGIALVMVVLAVGGVAATVIGPGFVGGGDEPELDSGHGGPSGDGSAVSSGTPIVDDGTVAPDTTRDADTSAEDDSEPATEIPTATTGTTGTRETPTGQEDFQTDRYVTLEPTCNRSYLHVVQIQMNALRYNDNETNDGIRTVRRFSSPRNREAFESFDQFVRVVYSPTYAPMLTYDSVEYTPDRTSQTDAQVTVITKKEGEITGRYTFHLTKQTDGEYEGCWMTDAVRTNTIAR